MKKWLFSLALICLTAFGSLHAQLIPTPYYGIKGGLNATNMWNGGMGDPILRGHIGLFAGVDFSWIGLQAELLYSGSGTGFLFTGTLPSEDGKVQVNDIAHINLNYLSVPLLAKFYILGGLNIYSGVSVSALVRTRFNYRGDRYDIDVNANTMDVGIPMGIAFDTNRFALDLRYQVGLSDVIDDNIGLDRNSLISFAIGYKF